MGNIAFRFVGQRAQADATNPVVPVPFDHNLYVNKKHTVQGALNMSILATNIPALIRLYDKRNYTNDFIKFFTPSVVFLLISIFIELFNMIITLWVGVYYDVTNPADQDNAQRLTNLSIVCSALSTVVSFVIAGLGTTTSNATMTFAPTISPVGNATSA